MTEKRQDSVRREDLDLVLGRARYRAAVVAGLVALGYGAIVLRAAPLMLLEDERLQAKAAIQFQRAVEVRAPRGDIRAADGTLLATTVPMPALHADPSVIPQEQVPVLAQDLAELIGGDAEWIEGQLRRTTRRDVKLAFQISPEVEDEVEALDPGNALWTPDAPTRFYPGRDLAAQVLGVTGLDGRGMEGLESALDDDLRGTTFRYVQQRDRRGRAISTELEGRSRALAGDTVWLTIDPYVQRVTEDALDQIMEKSEPLSAFAVVMDVETGAILALGNRPVTNPNDRFNRSADGLRNHAIADAHEPGSVMKPFVVSLAVDDGIARPTTLIDCEGGRYRIGRTTIKDDHAHDVVTLSEVVKYSSNIGTAKLAFEMGADRVVAGLKDYGFTTRTGLSVPGEVRGFLRDPAKIKPIELATTAFGQGMTSTGIQLASALQALGNEGLSVQPYLVERIEDRHGQLEFAHEHEELLQVVSEESARQTVEMMATVFEDGGTGQRVRIPGYTAAGKTGTAQKVVDGKYSPTARVSSFVGLAPANDPRIAIVVVTDTPTEGSRYGGTVSGPAFRDIGQATLRYLGVEEDRLDEDDVIVHVNDEPAVALARPELTWTTEGAIRVPDMSGLSMRDALAVVDGAGFALALVGSGTVSEQLPAAGAALQPGERLALRFD
ncbi:MAG: transpeptidase family protein [Proteobacteria bacterium]|nr:transpeptidase family protein [Pseudomonadota bacterium]